MCSVHMCACRSDTIGALLQPAVAVQGGGVGVVEQHRGVSVLCAAYMLRRVLGALGAVSTL